MDEFTVRPVLADWSHVSLHKPVLYRHGIVQFGVEARKVVCEVLAVELQAKPFGFSDDPMQCLVCGAVRV